ncbi:TPA: hypothetical protein ACHAL5_002960, partial [Enterococcus faecium]
MRKTRLQGGKLRPLSAYYKFKPKRRFKGITSQNVSDNINIRGGILVYAKTKMNWLKALALVA